MAAPMADRVRAILQDADIDPSAVVCVHGWMRDGVLPGEAYVDPARGLLLFVAADVDTAEKAIVFYDGMRDILYAMGQERNQRVLGVGVGVSAFIIGRDAAADLIREERQHAKATL
jgi:hypothetical protein